MQAKLAQVHHFGKTAGWKNIKIYSESSDRTGTSNECVVIEVTPHDASEAQCKILTIINFFKPKFKLS